MPLRRTTAPEMPRASNHRKTSGVRSPGWRVGRAGAGRGRTNQISHMATVRAISGIPPMLYTMNQCQLLRLWSVMHCFTQIREINDPVTQSEILTNAQVLLTAFVIDLKPLVGDQPSSALPRTSLDQIATFDA
jgi:hypothetical protein